MVQCIQKEKGNLKTKEQTAKPEPGGPGTERRERQDKAPDNQKPELIAKPADKTPEPKRGGAPERVGLERTN